MNHKTIAAAAALAAVIVLAGCDDGKTDSTSTNRESEVAETQLDQFLTNQPVPSFNWSQLRQNLIEIETAQANTTATTSFFFNQGVDSPVMSCPSIGFPIPSTYQLTNPQKAIEVGVQGEPNPAVTLDQLEANGVYTGDSTGTYVICINDAGDGYAFYWEGYVAALTGPATWDGTQIVLTGDPSGDFSTEEG